MATKKHSSQLIPLLLVLLALAIVVAVFAFNEVRTRQKNLYSYNQMVTSSRPTSTYPSFGSDFTPVIAQPVTPEEKWETYTNHNLGISLKHPSDWFFNEFSAEGGLTIVWSTPIDNPSTQNWRIGQLAGGEIYVNKLGANETLASYLQRIKTENGSIWAKTTTIIPSFNVDNKEVIGLEMTGYSSPAVYFFVDDNGVVYDFDFGTTYQSAESNYQIYLIAFEKMLSTVTFSK